MGEDQKEEGGRKSGKVRSAHQILSVALLLVIAQEDSHKNMMFPHFPTLSGARSAPASIIGSDTVSAHLHISHRWYYC